jgi:large subunit ribosomal protein L20
MRVKRGVQKAKHRRNTLAKTKGMRGRIHKKERAANEAIAHAGNHAFQHRRKKKGDFRALWQTRISAAVAPHGLSYSRFMSALKKKGIALDRKSLAAIAVSEPEAFERIVKQTV